VYIIIKLGARIVTSDPLLAFYALFTGPSPLDQSEGDNDHRTFIEATPDGWFYSALLSRQPCTRIVAFHTIPTHSSAKLARRRDGFLDILHSSAPHTSAIILGNDYEISGDGFPGCTAAGSSYLDKACDFENRWIAVGDSAMAFDPLSSQGMMTALEMGYYVGATLASQLDGADADERLGEGIVELYDGVKEDYVGQRAYYYGIVKRFEGQDFWNKIILV
jgi:2-polyprenyl-6-methoxyphenol hydroxylase-like FAD-dependent oxidoreductase